MSMVRSDVFLSPSDLCSLARLNMCGMHMRGERGKEEKDYERIRTG